MSLKLLVVDDEIPVVKFLKEALGSLGYEVLALSDSREALRRIGREKFDGGFFDARMPDIDGIELTRAVRASESNSGMPIVMLTAFDDVNTMRAAFKAGVTFFQPKPVGIEKLAGLLHHMRDAMMRERRSYVRLPLRTVVACTLGGHRFKSASLNISEGGMMLEGTGGAAQGQELELRFSIPGVIEMLHPVATVVRLDPGNRMAVRFTRLDSEGQNALRSFIAGALMD